MSELSLKEQFDKDYLSSVKEHGHGGLSSARWGLIYGLEEAKKSCSVCNLAKVAEHWIDAQLDELYKDG